MKRIDDIKDLDKKCTGCMGCVDVCPTRCISQIIHRDSFMYSTIDTARCVSCGKCYSVCPVETQEKHHEEQHLFAAYSADNLTHNSGSSGGMFELLARYFLKQNYYVSGATFDNTTLKHRIISSREDIKPLLKSKYIQSDAKGIYAQIKALLQKGEKVFFCGTPCQVSTLINSTSKDVRDNLFTADIVCHGVPSQKIFDDYIKTLEKKHNGKVSGFSFRVKDNRYKHAHGYSYQLTKDGKTKTINGIYTDSSFYNGFKNYLFFRNGCYDCQYTTVERVSDITLADFWGIEKYDFDGNVDAGVSMVITNSEKGRNAFDAIREKTISKEFPIQYGIESNHCLTHRTEKPRQRDAIIEELATRGYEPTAEKYFKSGFIHRVYWLIPQKMRTFIRKIRGN
ncbi:MAG: 4Fe-4S dicluster domain-containing protein [Ruminococcaceae bacterium]|nr:4Fe-4S dicluster domain-containing protein [Oscillospiraceae bacterium]